VTGTYLYLICHGKVTANVEPAISGIRATAGFSHGVAQAIAPARSPGRNEWCEVNADGG